MLLCRWLGAVASRSSVAAAGMRRALLGRRIVVVVRVELDERLTAGVVTAAALVAASIMWAAGAPPRLGGVPVLGAVMLAAGLTVSYRLMRPARPRR
jgi:hypothetical protein